MIQTLVECFAEQSERYQQTDYNEAQTRTDFITPFFQALAWDVQNQQDVAEPYRPVVLEQPLRHGHVTKIPDYSFRMGGVRKFFVEAKKPAVNLKTDAEPALQVRRYGWNAKLSLSIVTNFAEFAVYDCRLQPNRTDKAATARLWYLRYTDYVKNWDKLVEYFSFDAVWQGSLEKYLMQQATPKGILTVDAAFLNEIEGWREQLAHNLIQLNPNITSRQMNVVVQQTIDRIIFLRICEDRGIEDYGKLLGLTRETQIYARLLQLFYQADARYNSGLFHFKAEFARDTPDQLTPKLQIADAILTKVLKNLYYPDSPYEFSVFPADILGQVYEQFLGKIIRLTEARHAVVEEKPEVKKAGGVYYTPTYIVDYIVKKTLGQLVAGKTIQQVSQLKILDPACGSGSFLLEVYEFLLAWHLENYLKDKEKWTKGKQPCLYQATGGGWKLTITERKRILLNNIYGIDIDTQAVEVTKLSLLLKVLEDEQSVISQLSLIRERVLPDLENNIKCGNSLISNDFYLGQPGLLDEETLYRVNAFDWKQEFAKIMQAGGFDAVLGNPPYGAIFKSEEKKYLFQHYPLLQGQPESYEYFLLQSLELTTKEGVIAVIVPTNFIESTRAERLREQLLTTTHIQIIANFRYNVWKNNASETLVALFQKGKIGQTQVTHPKTPTELAEEVDKNEFNQQDWLHVTGKRFLIRADMGLLRKIEATQLRLGDICEVGQGIIVYKTREDSAKNPYIADVAETAEWKKLLDTHSTVQRYSLTWGQKYLKYGDGLWCRREAKFFEQPKIILVRLRNKSLSRKLIGTYDEEKFYNRDNFNNIILKDERYSLKYILGLFNSKLLNYWYKSYFDNVNINPAQLRLIPIHAIDFNRVIAVTQHQTVVDLVSQLLELNRLLATMKELHGQKALQRQIVAVDAVIDNMVYELYDLTSEEIQMIENSE
jgi:type I restriction-modification system DNA methylase subunit